MTRNAQNYGLTPSIIGMRSKNSYFFANIGDGLAVLKGQRVSPRIMTICDLDGTGNEPHTPTMEAAI